MFLLSRRISIPCQDAILSVYRSERSEESFVEFLLQVLELRVADGPKRWPRTF